MEQVRVILVSSDETSKVLEPADRPLHFPASTEVAQLPSVLGRRFYSSATVTTDQFNAPTFQSVAKRIAISRLVVDQTTRLLSQNALFEERLDQRHFVGAGTRRVGAQRES